MSYYFFDFEIYGIEFYEITSFTDYDIEYIINNNIHNLYLNINDNYDIPLLPETITHLKLGRNFNRLSSEWVDKIEHITHIFFGNNFNKPLDYLPNSITHIFFGYEFNQSVDFLPKYLEFIKFGSKFDKSVDLLPNNLKYIVFGNMFNQPINHLPNNIIGIKLYHYFNHPISNLPDSTKYLQYSLYHKNPIFFPIKLEQLFLPNNYDDSIDSLPDTITHLHLGNIFNQKINKLPINLKYIIFSGFYSYDIACLNLFCKNLEYVELGWKYDIVIENLLVNITELVININYSHHYKTLPQKLVRLSVNLTNNNNLLDILYLTDLNYLKIDNYGNNSLILNRLPLYLKTLLLNTPYTICYLELPLELNLLKITQNYKNITEFYLVDQIEYFGIFL